MNYHVYIYIHFGKFKFAQFVKVSYLQCILGFFSSTNIVIEATLKHDNSSTAAAVNVSVLFYLPPYLLQSQLTANASTFKTSSEGGAVTIEVGFLIQDGLNRY